MKTFSRSLFAGLMIVAFALACGRERAGAAETDLAESEVSRCLSSLEQPTLANAVTAAGELRKLAETQQGAAKAATERLALVIRDLFYSEITVQHAKKGQMEAMRSAKAKERSAPGYLKPNVFGHTNPTAYQNALKQAQDLRESAAGYVGDAKAKLTAVVQATDGAIQGYRRAGRTATADTLARSMTAVMDRVKASPDLDPAENGQFNKELLAGLAILGLAMWSGSGSGSDGFTAPGGMSAGPAPDYGRSASEESQRERDQQRERDAVERQQAAWRAEAEEGARRRAMEAEAAAQRRAAEAEAAARQRSGF